MGRSKMDTEKAAKKSKVVTMPRRDGGEGADEAEKDKKKVAARKPKSGGAKETKARKKTAAKKLKKEEYKGSKKELRHWAKKVVKENSDAIAGELGAKARKGDLQSTEMLLDLMEKKKKKKGGEGDDIDGPSLADQLMAGPTWEEVLEARRQAKEEEEAASAAGS
jgi:hypothetical protein